VGLGIDSGSERRYEPAVASKGAATILRSNHAIAMKTTSLSCRRAGLLLALTFLLATSSACTGPAPGLASVTGKVLCDGQPAGGAILYFQRQPGGDKLAPNLDGVVPSATVQDDGSFIVESPPVGYGAAPGKYAVVAQWPEKADPSPDQANPKTKQATVKGKKITVSKRAAVDLVPVDRLKGRYMDKNKKLLPDFEIKVGTNDLGTIELTIGK
jgi:hypothetical protein